MEGPENYLNIPTEVESDESNQTEVLPQSIYDETRIPDKFINPRVAEGSDIHELKAGDFEMPVSLEIEDGRFFITGIQNESNKGGIVSGRISGDMVKINHLDLAKELRDSSKTYTGVANALLTDLEGQLGKQGAKTIYAAFFNTGTVEFFLKNGYAVIPAESLDEDTKKNLKFNLNNFDTKINNEEEFEKEKDREDRRQVLLRKNL